ncbi:hypothetical protein NQ314_019638, partial [Rhamnusium bicolor]
AVKRTLELERKDRSELERKALDLIKAAKLKWEIAEKSKVEALLLEQEQQKEKISQLTTTNNMLNEQLQHALKLEGKHKESLEKVQNLSRRSVIGLESRLEKITSETQSAISEMQMKLSEETHQKRILEVKLGKLIDREACLMNRLEQSQREYDDLKTKIDDAENVIKHLSDQESENILTENQELKELRTKYWRMEKDFGNCKIDKRILERELKDAQTEIKQLKQNEENFNKTLAETKKTHESALLELSHINESMSLELIKVKDSYNNLQDKFNNEKEKVDEEKSVIHDLKEIIKSTDLKINSLNLEICTLKRDKSLLENEIQRYSKEKSELTDLVERLQKEKSELFNELEKSRREMQNTNLNLGALREACVLLESQQAELNSNTEKLIQDLCKAKQAIQEARKLANEEKSLKVLAETKIKRLNEDIECLQRECSAYKQQCTEYRQYLTTVSDGLNMSEDKVSDLEVTLKSYERQMEDLKSENKTIKQEVSDYLTQLNKVKESNYKLNRQLGELKDEKVMLVQKLNELERVLYEKSNFYKERELKSESTIKQQIKLIDYLQTKNDELHNKKRTLTEVIFGSSKKENQPPISLAMNYKDLEMQLHKERQANKQLHEEIYRLKAATSISDNSNVLEKLKVKVDKQKSEILSPKTKIAMEQIVNSPNRPKEQGSTPVQSVPLKPENSHGKVILEPLPSEIGIPVANSDLAFILKVEVAPDTTSLQKLFYNDIERLKFEHILSTPDDMNVNCFVDLTENIKCAQCTKPKLKYSDININNLSGFHILQVSQFNSQQKVCVATSKQLIILNYDLESGEFVPQRILDTAEPTGCALFTENSLIVGANKFFEIDLASFQADEFLDISDAKLKQAVKCYQMGSYPLAIMQVSKNPIEFLLCFNEFSIFVDEYGRSSRNTEIKSSHLPLGFHYIRPYLYVVQFAAIEIIKISDDTCNDSNSELVANLDTVKLELEKVRCVGYNKKGIYISQENEIKFINARKIVDGDSSSVVSESMENESDRFSFTSSIVQSLDEI